MSLVIRPLGMHDVNFIHDSWRKSLWKNEVDQAAVPWYIFFEGMASYWRAVDALPGTVYTVAEFKEVPGEVIGYAVHISPTECLWLYVKAPYRRQGIGTALLQNADRLGTITRTGKAFAKSLGLAHDPYMLFTPKH